MQTGPIAIDLESVRQWLGTGSLLAILVVLLRYGRPVLDLWIEKKKLDIAERAAERQDGRAEDEARHQLTVSLLDAARREAASLEAKIAQNGFDQGYVLHMDEALRHIEAMVNAGNEVDLKAAIRMASAFLSRMRRLQEAYGTARNEAQRAESAIALIEHREAHSEGEAGGR